MTDSNQQMPTFAHFQLSQHVQKGLDDLGFTTPTKIQAQTIPSILENHDILGLAETGSGKTAAFGLPILSKIDFATKDPTALILAPTRELAIQVADALKLYGKYINDLRIAPICGGQRYDTQIKYLKRGAHIVVGTPGRVKDLIEKGVLILSDLQFCVLDEADEMLNMGFLEEVEWILKQTPQSKQSVFFSATMPAPIQKITKKYLRNPLEVKIKSKTKTAQTIEQRYLFTNEKSKANMLLQLLSFESFDAAIIFGRTKAMTEQLADFLLSNGFQCKALNGDMPQVKREKTIKQFRQGIFNVIVATDVAARGLDVDTITHVINYDMPENSLSYIHRIGRTGRAGRQGHAITLVTNREQYALSRIEQSTKQKIAKYIPPSHEAIAAKRFEKLTSEINAHLHTEHAKNNKALIQAFCQQQNLSELDVCAALMAMQHKPLGGATLKVDHSHHQESHSSRSHRRSDDRTPNPARNKGRKDNAKNKPSKLRAAVVRYKINVGKKDDARPANIVGAIANEASINRKLIGDIKIYDNHSTVELPSNLPNKALLALSKAWVAGKQLKAAKLN